MNLGWRGISWANTPAYFEHLRIESIKSLITMGPSQIMFPLALLVVESLAFKVTCHLIEVQSYPEPGNTN
jgi:hypothetical protein